MNMHGINQRKCCLIRKRGGPLLVLILLLTQGCVFSLNPWFGKDTKSNDPGLLGTWIEAEGNEQWVFLNEADSLSLLVRDGQDAALFQAASFQVGETRLLDLFPGENPSSSESLQSYFQPLHGLMRYEIHQDTLLINLPDYNRMKLLFEQNPEIQVWSGKDRWILLGGRDELTQLLRRHMLSDSMWEDVSLMLRD